MCTNIPLGAYNKYTNEYIYPAIANKLDKYICPDCGNDLILRRGEVRIPHFAHCKSDNPCNYYSHPSESQIHKDAKLLLKKLLESGYKITITRHCYNHTGPGEENDIYEIPTVDDTTKIMLEYRFNYNGPKIADVAFIDDNKPICLFEICNTHRTLEGDRPEPWFEINALDIIQLANQCTNHIINIQCIRRTQCEDCSPMQCNRCSKLIPKYIYNTYKYKCPSCAGEIYSNIYLHVPYHEKDAIKHYGGKFDGYYKKWYIDSTNSKKELILSKWKSVSY